MCDTDLQPPHVPRTDRRYHLGVMLLLFAVTLPLLRPNASPGAEAGVIIERDASLQLDVLPRQADGTCKRWSQQSAVVNGTLYLYGGQASTEPSQTTNTWNNDFLSLNLSTTWQIASPSMSILRKPSGPPAVANGYLWSSYTSLFLYGGEFSSKEPITSPVPFAGWEYDILSSSWKEQSSPMSSSGTNAPENGVAIQRSAEGAGFSVASQGRGWYFGGHQDGYTTSGWSQSTPRIYLKSLLEYTFPGANNSAIQSLSNGQDAGSSGAWRNITGGGSQASAGFPERADGVLVYVPDFGEEGILLGLAGGTNDTFTQLNVIDVYDVATSTWYKQATTGTTPSVRVNPCAVVVAAPDGSSYQVLLYGGQNLVPAGSQIQYDDLYILSVPAFAWIKVDTSGQSNPAGRAGHTCNVWDAQMVVVGGYVSTQLSCDSPGTYVFDLSKLQWVEQFTSLSNPKTNPYSIQHAQLSNSGAMSGSYGYEIPEAVQSVIGGGPTGGATITRPVATATGGPLATGKAYTYTVTGANGAVATETGTAGSTTGNNSSSGGSNHTTRTVAITVGVIAGVLAIAVVYLGICAWLYRKRLRLYQEHMEAEREARGASAPLFSGSDKQIPKSNSASEPSPYPSSSARSSIDDLLIGQEPSFFGIMLHPRRSLKVVNR